MRALSLLLAFLLLASTALAQNSGVPLPPPGQTPATQTNDNACATCVGAIVSTGAGGTGSQTVTISIASPAVVSDTNAGVAVGNGEVVNFQTTGALPTGLAVGTNYYVINVVPGVSYQLSATAFGPAINTSGTQSGTQTRVPYALLNTSAQAQDVAAVQLPPGQWQCTGTLGPNTTATPTVVNGYFTTISNGNTGIITASRVYTNGAFGATYIAWEATAPINLQVASTTIYYLDMAITFASGTAVSNGQINCLRTR